MSLNFSLLPLLFTFLIIILALIKRGNKPKNLPPSPWKLPLIGNMHQLLGQLPHRALDKLSRRYGPIMHLKLGQVDHVIISSPEAAREILKTHDQNFASRPQLISPTIFFYDNKDIAFAPYGSYWRQVRKICTLELLSTRRVKGFGPIREEENSALVTSIMSMSGKSTINLTEKLFMLSNTITAKAAFSSECKHGPRFIREVKKALTLMSGFNLADLYPSLKIVGGLLGMNAKLERVRSHIDEILDEIIMEHQERKLAKNSNQDEGKEEEDLVDVLLRLKDEGDFDFPLDMINIKAVTLEMFAAGTETSSTALIWAMTELIRNPATMKKAQDEVRQVAKGKATITEGDIEKLQYVKLVIKETLRLHPPIPLLLPRLCQETCNVGGFEIPAGCRIIINYWSIARDPKNWEDAESFKPERFQGSSVDFIGENFQYLPFGGGRRICPGIAFAMASVELTLAHMLVHFDWDLPVGEEAKKLDMTESLGVTMGRKEDLCLVATPCFVY